MRPTTITRKLQRAATAAAATSLLVALPATAALAAGPGDWLPEPPTVEPVWPEGGPTLVVPGAGDDAGPSVPLPGGLPLAPTPGIELPDDLLVPTDPCAEDVDDEDDGPPIVPIPDDLLPSPLPLLPGPGSADDPPVPHPGGVVEVPEVGIEVPEGLAPGGFEVPEGLFTPLDPCAGEGDGGGDGEAGAPSGPSDATDPATPAEDPSSTPPSGSSGDGGDATTGAPGGSGSSADDPTAGGGHSAATQGEATDGDRAVTAAASDTSGDETGGVAGTDRSVGIAMASPVEDAAPASSRDLALVAALGVTGALLAGWATIAWQRLRRRRAQR